MTYVRLLTVAMCLLSTLALPVSSQAIRVPLSRAALDGTTGSGHPVHASSSYCPASPTHGTGGPGWGWAGTDSIRAISAWWGRRAHLNVASTGSGYVQKVLWKMRRALHQTVTLRGQNLRTRMPIRFHFADQGPGTQPVGAEAHLDPWYPNAMSSSARDRGWLGYSSEVLLPSLGCYVLYSTWKGGSWTLTFYA